MSLYRIGQPKGRSLLVRVPVVRYLFELTEYISFPVHSSYQFYVLLKFQSQACKVTRWRAINKSEITFRKTVLHFFPLLPGPLRSRRYKISCDWKNSSKSSVRTIIWIILITIADRSNLALYSNRKKQIITGCFQENDNFVDVRPTQVNHIWELGKFHPIRYETLRGLEAAKLAHARSIDFSY